MRYILHSSFCSISLWYNIRRHLSSYSLTLFQTIMAPRKWDAYRALNITIDGAYDWESDDYPVYDAAAFVSRRSNTGMSGAARAPPSFQGEVAAPEERVPDIEDTAEGRVSGILGPAPIALASPRLSESPGISGATSSRSLDASGDQAASVCRPAQRPTSDSLSIDRGNAYGTLTSSASVLPTHPVPQKATIPGKSTESKDGKATKGISENRTGKSGSRPSMLSKFKNAMQSK
jgi:hypothetical protein